LEKLPKISAIAITLNEEAALPAYIESLYFADEIIIVDSKSIDKTLDIAKINEKITVYQREFDNFSAQKNFAISKANHDWVVFFDLDEEITKPLASEIITTLKNPKAVAYYVNREFHFMGKRIKYSGLQNDNVVRLFDKNYCQYNSNLVHEVLEVDGETAILKNRLPHYTYKDFDNYTSKMHRYSELQAQMLYKKGKKPTGYHFFFRPWYRFMSQYFLRLGILDGKEGFILAYTSAFSVFKRYVHLWLLYRNID
jgi:glycosyltransferase involved in cell wall biosynthesis